MTLAELLDSHGQAPEALELLLPVYGWFNEGFDTRDLKKAAELIQRLSNAPLPRAPVPAREHSSQSRVATRTAL